jgi:protoporphyrinogen oxidase
MQAIPEQIAAHLNPKQIRLNTPVERIDGKTVFLANGETITADKIVIATDAPVAAKLLNEQYVTPFNSTDCVYFSTDRPLSISGKSYLIINANADELIDHLVVLSDIAPSYSPSGKTLISVSVVGKNDLSEMDLNKRIEVELTQWFGNNHAWQHLKTYRIPNALPQYFEGSNAHKPLKINDFTFRCGDYTAYPSLNAAMKTGREVAELLTVARP